jgi:hypothetical protein
VVVELDLAKREVALGKATNMAHKARSSSTTNGSANRHLGVGANDAARDDIHFQSSGDVRFVAKLLSSQV